MQTNIVAATTNTVSMGATNHATTYDITLWVLTPLILIILATLISQKMEVKWPTFKWKWNVGWIHGRILAVWVFLILTIKHFFPTEWDQWFNTHGWYGYLTLIAVTTLFLYLFGRKSQATTGASGGPGGGVSGKTVLAVAVAILLIPLIVLGITDAVKTIRGNAEGQTMPSGIVALTYLDLPEIPLTVYPEVWTPIDVQEHRDLHIIVDNGDCVKVILGTGSAELLCDEVGVIKTIVHPVKRGRYTALVTSGTGREVRIRYRLVRI